MYNNGIYITFKLFKGERPGELANINTFRVHQSRNSETIVEEPLAEVVKKSLSEFDFAINISVRVEVSLTMKHEKLALAIDNVVVNTSNSSKKVKENKPQIEAALLKALATVF